MQFVLQNGIVFSKQLFVSVRFNKMFVAVPICRQIWAAETSRRISTNLLSFWFSRSKHGVKIIVEIIKRRQLCCSRWWNKPWPELLRCRQRPQQTRLARPKMSWLMTNPRPGALPRDPKLTHCLIDGLTVIYWMKSPKVNIIHRVHY